MIFITQGVVQQAGDVVDELANMMVGGEELEKMASDPEMKLVAKEPAKEIARPTDGGPR